METAAIGSVGAAGAGATDAGLGTLDTEEFLNLLDQLHMHQL